MLERNILIIDDNARVKEVYIPAYLSRINTLKKGSEKWSKYLFNIIHLSSMKATLEYLSDPTHSIDVLVVDYDFNGETTFTNGTAFVKYIREQINRYCQIIFYTMQGPSNIDVEEWTALVNSDVFRFIDKSTDDNILGEVIFEAATRRNPIVESLEHFWCRYRTMLETYTYTFSGQAITFEEIICHIRMDDEIGRVFVEKLLQKAILLNTDV